MKKRFLLDEQSMNEFNGTLWMGSFSTRRFFILIGPGISSKNQSQVKWKQVVYKERTTLRSELYLFSGLDWDWLELCSLYLLKRKKGLRPIEGRLYLLNSYGMMKPILEQSLSPYQGKVLLWSTYRSSLPLSIDRVTFTSFPRTGLLLERKYLSTLLVEEDFSEKGSNRSTVTLTPIPFLMGQSSYQSTSRSRQFVLPALTWMKDFHEPVIQSKPIQFHSSGGIRSKTCMQNRDDSTMRHGHYKEKIGKIGREKGLTLS